MPLSEYEQRVLEQMERALTSDDPRLANTLQSSGRRSVLRYVLAGLGVVVGLLLLVVGVASSNTWIGVVGFVLMFAGVVFAVAAPRRKSGPAGVVDAEGNVTPTRPGQAKARGKSEPGGWSGFLTRLEERWDKRRDQGR
ncbi:spore wall synthesis complex protein [Myceligenerans cantabricum]